MNLLTVRRQKFSKEVEKMTCYAIPLIGALLCHVWRTHGHERQEKYFWLNLMLGGGAIFGVVDHLWNGELFLVGPNIAMDLALGAAITLTIVAAWALVIRMAPATTRMEAVA